MGKLYLTEFWLLTLEFRKLTFLLQNSGILSQIQTMWEKKNSISSSRWITAANKWIIIQFYSPVKFTGTGNLPSFWIILNDLATKLNSSFLVEQNVAFGGHKRSSCNVPVYLPSFPGPRWPRHQTLPTVEHLLPWWVSIDVSLPVVLLMSHTMSHFAACLSSSSSAIRWPFLKMILNRALKINQFQLHSLVVSILLASTTLHLQCEGTTGEVTILSSDWLQEQQQLGTTM